MRFECQVYETVVLLRRYTAEADSVEEAKDLANQGETVSEQTISTVEVINREVLSCTPAVRLRNATSQ
jgi:methyl-accepting chemotaxis protein